ncbi:hypothetical protein [Dyella sp. EPa41]|nr:hypothetical protein [Dyella sp. EPa41]
MIMTLPLCLAVVPKMDRCFGNIIEWLLRPLQAKAKVKGAGSWRPAPA